MNWKKGLILFLAGFLGLSTGCKHASKTNIIVEIPPGFNGNFQLEMGVKDAPPLMKQGDAYVVTVSRDGKLTTSTLLTNPQTQFRNASDGSVWGYSQSVFTTGDGIPVTGKIQFFVGTKKDYEAEENKKNHSREFLEFGEYPAGA
jgi:hypothetical protein